MGTSAVGAEALDYLQEEVEWDKDIYPRWLEDPKIAHKEEAQLQPSVLSLGPTFHLKGSGPPPRQEHVCTPHSAWAVGKVLSWDLQSHMSTIPYPRSPRWRLAGLAPPEASPLCPHTALLCYNPDPLFI